MPFVKANGIDIHYETKGMGKPILFIHGSGVSWRFWEPQFEAFSKKYKMIMIDLRGHGESSKEFPDGVYSIRVLAEDIKQFLDTLNIKKITIIGLSQGGVVASLFASKYPKYMEKLVFSNSYSEIPTNVASWVLNVSNAIFRFIPFTMIKKLVLLPYGKDEYTKQIIRDSLSIDKAMLLAMKTSEFPTHTGDLHRITAPTLILAGDRKNVGPEEKAAKILFDHIPKAIMAVFKDAFDPISTMRRDIFNVMILDFLADQKLQAYNGVQYYHKSFI